MVVFVNPSRLASFTRVTIFPIPAEQGGQFCLGGIEEILF